MKENITLMNSRAWLNDDSYTYEDYQDFCEANGITPASDTSREFGEWRYSEAALDFEIDFDNLKECKQYKYSDFVITGQLGLWNGSPEIVPVRVNGLANAIARCIRNCDDAEVKLNPNTGVISVNAYHHDGCNCFDIHLLRDNCVDAFNNAYEKWDCGYTDGVNVKKGWLKKIDNPYNVA